MLVQSFLVQGATAASAVGTKLGSLNPTSLDGLVLMSLGIDHEQLIGAVLKDNNNNQISCPIFVTETYGIIGYDEEIKQNIELMEKGRGSEYGFRGGTGGQGCLAIGYSDGAILGCNDDDVFPPDASSLMVIADQSGSWKNVITTKETTTPLHYGGITKTAWKLEYDNEKNGGGRGGSLVQVPYFWVADNTPIGVSTFTGEAGSATKSILSKLPSGYKLSGSIGLFPCFSRGVNQYNEEHVEPTAIGNTIINSAASVDSMPPRIYGMFAHGELGPIDFADFTTTKSSSNNDCIPCTQHSGSSILSIHTLPN